MCSLEIWRKPSELLLSTTILGDCFYIFKQNTDVKGNHHGSLYFMAKYGKIWNNRIPPICLFYAAIHIFNLFLLLWQKFHKATFCYFDEIQDGSKLDLRWSYVLKAKTRLIFYYFPVSKFYRVGYRFLLKT